MYIEATKARSPGKELKRLEDHFLDDVAKGISDDIWIELSFNSTELEKDARGEILAHERAVDVLYSQLFDLADVRTGLEHFNNVATETVSAV